jgi:hypothetical protein
MPIACPIPCIICTPGAPGSRGLSPVDDNPFLNLSSEAPDVNVFIGRRYTPFVPPLGKFFYAVSCVGYCFSSTSQADADLCAGRQNALCNSVNWPQAPIIPQDPNMPVVRPPSNVFPNQRQVATFTCANGSVFTYEVGAGSFFASSTAQANAFALSYARNHANQAAICLTALSPTRICFKQDSTCTLTATNFVGELVFGVVGGFLPDGMTLEQDGTFAEITGTPVAGGTFTFTIAVTDSVGGYAEQAYSLEVFGITNDTALAAATVGTPYSQALNLDGTPDGVFDYTISAGALPSGLTLNATSGIISGTPTLATSASFTVKVSDASISCSRDFTMAVAGGGFDCMGNPSDIQNMVWTQQPLDVFGNTMEMPPCGIFTAAAGTGTFFVESNLTTCLFGSIDIKSVICNPGAAYNMTITVPWDDAGLVDGGFAHLIQVQLYFNGVGVATDVKDLVTGPFTPFVVTALLPANAVTIVDIKIPLLAFPTPSVSAFSLGNFTITPLTHP